MFVLKKYILLGNHNCNYVCRRSLNSYTGQNVLLKHKEQCDEQGITSLRSSDESHFYWKINFHKNPLYFRIYAGFGAAKEIDSTQIGKKNN